MSIKIHRRRSIRTLGLVLGALALNGGASGCKDATEPTRPASPPLEDPAPETAIRGEEKVTETCMRFECPALGPDCSPARTSAAPESCGRTFFVKSGGTSSGGTDPVTFGTNGPDTVANARCALEALRDGKPGRLPWGYSGGVETYDETIEIVAGRRAFGSFGASYDSPLTKGGYAAAPLQPASFFDECLTEGTVDAYARCLASAIAPCPK